MTSNGEIGELETHLNYQDNLSNLSLKEFHLETSGVSLNTSIDNEFHHERLNLPIFKESNLSIKSFNLILALFISRFNLSFKCADELLKLLQFILPQPNNLNKKLNTIIDQIDIIDQSKVEYLCPNCWYKKNELSESCKNEECEFYSDVKESIEVHLFDINKQLNEIIEREEENIL